MKKKKGKNKIPFLRSRNKMKNLRWIGRDKLYIYIYICKIVVHFTNKYGSEKNEDYKRGTREITRRIIFVCGERKRISD